MEAEGERQAAPHPLPLLEAAGRRLHIQQHLRAVVVGQRHAAHQPEDRETGGEEGETGRRGRGYSLCSQADTDPGITSF